MDKAFLNKIPLLGQVILKAYYVGDNDHEIISKTEMFLDNIIQKCGISEMCFLDKAEKLKILLENEITLYISRYDKIELQVGLLAHKAYCRSQMMKDKNLNKDYRFSNMQEEIIELLNIIDRSKMNGRKSILNIENLNIPYVLKLMYFYNVLQDNIKHIKYKLLNEEDLEETLDLLFKEAVYYSKEYDEYMNDLLLEVQDPEEIEIKTKTIQEKLVQIKKNKEKISEDVENIIFKYFGFTFEDLDNFACWGLRQKDVLFVIALEKDEYYNILYSEYDMKRSAFENIIKLFSLKNNSTDRKIDLNRVTELRSILEIGNIIVFQCFDIIPNINCFKKFTKRKHFVEYFTTGWLEKEKESLNQELSKYEENMSSFFAYGIADLLYQNEYILPLDNNDYPYAEVKSIIAKTGKKMINILKNYGDIDVIAANIKKKEIYNIEIKYYKPLHQLYEMSSEFKVEERNKNIVAPMERERVLKENQDIVKKFLKISDESKYEIRTIFISPRPDYWLKTNMDTVEYYSYGEILKKVALTKESN